MQKLKVTEEWAADMDACPRAMKRFFQRWPKGLTLNRRNLYMAARVCPVRDLMWLGCTLHAVSSDAFADMQDLAQAPGGGYVVSQQKKRAVAKALADALNL